MPIGRVGDDECTPRRRHRRDRVAAIALGFAAVAFVATLVATRHGPRIHPDSVTYISAERNLVGGKGFTDFTGKPLTNFPPGFPALLTLGEPLGFDAESTARVLNAAAYAAIVILTFRLLRRHVGTLAVVGGATALVGVSPLLLRVGEYAVSDPVFVALSLGFLLVLDVALADPKRRLLALSVAALLVWAAFLVRYAGLTLVTTGVIAIALSSARDGLRAAASRALLFLTIAVIGPALWLVRNATSGAPDIIGPRVASKTGPLSLSRTTARRVVGIVGLPRTPAAMNLAFLLTIVALLVLGVVVWLRGRHARRAHKAPAGPTLLPIVTFVVVYTLFAVISKKTAGSTLDYRILSPTYAPLVILGARGFEVVHRGVAELSAKAARALMVTSLVWLLLIAIWFGHLAEQSGGRAERPPSIDSLLAHEVKSLDQHAVVLTNDPWRLYYRTGRQPVGLSPGHVVEGSSHRPPTVDKVVRDVACNDTRMFLVWFPQPGTRGLESPEKLHRRLHLITRRTTDNGTLFEIRSSDSSSERPQRCDGVA